MAKGSFSFKVHIFGHLHFSSTEGFEDISKLIDEMNQCIEKAALMNGRTIEDNVMHDLVAAFLIMTASREHHREMYIDTLSSLTKERLKEQLSDPNRSTDEKVKIEEDLDKKARELVFKNDPWLAS